MIRIAILFKIILWFPTLANGLCFLDDYNPDKEGIYAKMVTQRGIVWIALEFEKTPMTVANFIGLAEGSIENSYTKHGQPFYDGLTFHRVVENRAVQGGCPEGDGFGNPGYRFKDELVKELKHDKAGILSMANSGKNTNGSQFYITLGPEPKLDGKYVVFGSVVSGQDVVRLLEIGDKIDSIRIFRIGEKRVGQTLEVAEVDRPRPRKRNAT